MVKEQSYPWSTLIPPAILKEDRMYHPRSLRVIVLASALLAQSARQRVSLGREAIEGKAVEPVDLLVDVHPESLRCSVRPPE